MYDFCEKIEFSYATIVFKYTDLSLSLYLSVSLSLSLTLSHSLC